MMHKQLSNISGGVNYISLCVLITIYYKIMSVYPAPVRKSKSDMKFTFDVLEAGKEYVVKSLEYLHYNHSRNVAAAIGIVYDPDTECDYRVLLPSRVTSRFKSKDEMEKYNCAPMFKKKMKLYYFGDLSEPRTFKFKTLEITVLPNSQPFAVFWRK